MNKSRPEKTTPKPIQVEDALRHLTAGVGQLDGDRAAAYGELTTFAPPNKVRSSAAKKSTP